MDAGEVFSAIGSGLPIIGGIFNTVSQNIANKKNIELQRETNAKNEAMTRESWARDDNAVQRRVADLKAAGLSPTLAAGSPAGTSQPIRAQSPSVESNRSGDALIGAAQAMQMQADYSMTRAQTNLLKQEAAMHKQNVVSAKLDNQLKEQQLGAGSTRLQRDQYEFEYLKRTEGRRLRELAQNEMLRDQHISANRLKAELDQLGLSEAKFNVLYDRTERAIKEDLLREGLSGARLDNAIKNITLENARFDQEFYHSFNVPIGSTSNQDMMRGLIRSGDVRAKQQEQETKRRLRAKAQSLIGGQ